MWKVILIVLAVLYALNPFDVLPDLIVGWGWLDDIVILGLLWRYLHAQKKKKEAFQKYYQNQQSGNDRSRDNADGGQGSRTHTHSSDFADAWDPYKILGVGRSASVEDIKRAYRHLAGQYHPDKVMHLGEEFKTLAEKRFKDIQRAYSELVK